jgi:hypothetical protein
MALPILDGNQTAATLSTVLTGGEHIPAHTVASLGSQAITDMRSAVSGSVVSISNFPSTQTIAGTVTANSLPDFYDASNDRYLSRNATFVEIGVDEFMPVGINYSLPISGTVTVAGFSTVSVGGTIGGLVISGRRSGLAENILLDSSTGHLQAIPQVPNGMGGYANVSDALPLPVKGSVTIGANPSGALTTRFGSVTTANTAQITSAVTNTSRKYLLAQNISAGTVTIGIGFSPTTTQGIQLTAGAGLTFDSFCPTGAVYWLGAVTGAAFTILEG